MALQPNSLIGAALVAKQALARRWGVSPRTVNNLMLRGLPHMRVSPKLVRFDPVAADRWLRDNFARGGAS